MKYPWLAISLDFVLTPVIALYLCCSTDLEWKIIYVGSAESEEYDQTLDTVVVGPLCAGRHMFVFEVNSILFYLNRRRNCFKATCMLKFYMKLAD